MSNEQRKFADFFQASREPCLRAVLAVVGSAQPAEDQVAEAFAKAWASWRNGIPAKVTAGSPSGS